MLTLHRLPMLFSGKRFWTRGSVALVVASVAGIFIQAAPVHAYLKNPVNSVQRTLDADTLLAVEHVKHNGGKQKDKNKGKNNNPPPPPPKSHVAISGTVAVGGTVTAGGQTVTIDNKVAVDTTVTGMALPDNIASDNAAGEATAGTATTGGGEADATGAGAGDSTDRTRRPMPMSIPAPRATVRRSVQVPELEPAAASTE